MSTDPTRSSMTQEVNERSYYDYKRLPRNLEITFEYNFDNGRTYIKNLQRKLLKCLLIPFDKC